MTRYGHTPEGDPCTKCGGPLLQHHPRHRPTWNPCDCGVPSRNHRMPLSKGERRKTKRARPYVGLDGEGCGRRVVNEDGEFVGGHRYVFLGASNDEGDRVWSAEDKGGLSTEACLEMILDLPANARIFAYSFGYDLTMILKDLPNHSLYKLVRPDLRKWKKPGKERLPPFPEKWRDYSLNLYGSRFSVKKGKKTRIVWDIFKFYQAKFVNALDDWNGHPDEVKYGRHKIIAKEALAHMRKMKDSRADFDRIYAEDPESVARYCLEECACIARLARALVEAHEEADLDLRAFHGAGSSAAAMLKKLGIKEKLVPAPVKMEIAVASAFFGGRFENSVIGHERSPTNNFDISSAYPYQLFFLPCLEHARWRFTRDETELEGRRAALVRYRLTEDNARKDWAPFPFRTRDGSICYPRTSPGGWVWLDEYRAGKRLWDGVEFRGAWVYESDCDCQPFAEIAQYYRERVRIGKEGPGIVYKLGMNSCYGKLAQSVGSAIFNSWVWAGMITSGTRAQLLEVIGLHEDRSNVLMLATDGVFTREDVTPPRPRDTGTWETKKALGGWEKKAVRPMFIARPGIYFPIDPSEDEIKTVKARGLGKGIVHKYWKPIVDAYEEGGIRGVCTIPNIVRFCGIKSSISKFGPKHYPMYRRQDATRSEMCYGEWVPRAIEVAFDPMPKRERAHADGKRLVLREIPTDERASYPYSKAIKCPETVTLEALVDEILEQPDADLVEYGL